jgi:hypothetical protein
MITQLLAAARSRAAGHQLPIPAEKKRPRRRTSWSVSGCCITLRICRGQHAHPYRHGPSKAGYTAAKRKGDGTSEVIRQFDPTVKETLFIPRLVGG